MDRLTELDRIDRIVQMAADRHKVDVALVRGVIQVESGFDPLARSAAGARGLMQLMPKTAAALARRLGWERYDLHDPAFNVDAGVAYLAHLLRQFDDNAHLALAAYHTGPSRVARWILQGTPLPSYSRRYVRAVIAASAQLRHGPPQVRAVAELDSAGLTRLVRGRLYGPRADQDL